MREELLNRFLMILIRNNIKIDNIKEEAYIILDDYEIQKRTTELITTDENRNEELIKTFLIAKHVKGCTATTIEYYKLELKKIILELGKTIDNITTQDIRYYLAKRQVQDKVTKTTIDNELRVLRSFFKFLTMEEIIVKDPTTKIDRIKVDKKKKKAFTDLEIERMRSYLKDDLRIKAMFELLLSTGCRISEANNIKIDDIQENKVNVLGKGNKERTVYLNAKAQLAILEYLEKRTDSNPYLFAKSNKKCKGKLKRNWWQDVKYVDEKEHVDNSAIESNFRQIAKKLGLESANPHRFRRTCATFALRRGMPIEQVSKMLGHESLETTQIYLDLTQEELENMHKKYVI